MSKADQIRELLHLPNFVIAERLGRPFHKVELAYIRAVRQRTSSLGNPITPATQRNWKAENPERIRAMRQRYRERRRAA